MNAPCEKRYHTCSNVPLRIIVVNHWTKLIIYPNLYYLFTFAIPMIGLHLQHDFGLEVGRASHTVSNWVYLAQGDEVSTVAQIALSC
jgi:hypothetical protein